MKQTIVTLWLFFAFGPLLHAQADNEFSLPVRMASMHAARISENQAHIKWQVICRVSFAKFEIQKSINGVNFETIHSFQADKVRCQSPFDYIDAAATGQGYYRIRVGDIDGQFTSEKIIFVGGIKGETTSFIVINPVVNGHMLVRASIRQKQTFNFVLIDPTGRNVYQQQMEFNEGGISFNWYPSVKWVNGYYTLVVVGTDYKQVIRLLKL